MIDNTINLNQPFENLRRLCIKNLIKGCYIYDLKFYTLCRAIRVWTCLSQNYSRSSTIIARVEWTTSKFPVLNTPLAHLKGNLKEEILWVRQTMFGTLKWSFSEVGIFSICSNDPIGLPLISVLPNSNEFRIPTFEVGTERLFLPSPSTELVSKISSSLSRISEFRIWNYVVLWKWKVIQMGQNL